MKIKNSGFTLVELLIVIAIIGVLAAALVATLNPIEQINKARDTRYKNDAAEVLGAIERYYASAQTYPWTASGVTICGAGSTLCTDAEVLGASAEIVGVGVCADNTCTTDGVLITTGELKPSFKRKNQFVSGAEPVDKIYIYKEDTASGATYACFIPKSNVNRETAVLADIVSGEGAYQDPVDCTDPGSASDWEELDSTCFICVPEVGSVITPEEPPPEP